MKNILILGDSYSTFKDCIPNGFATYYPNLDVGNVEETWWSNFIQYCKCNLLQNNSWSGSTIGYTGYNSSDKSKSSSFIYRFRQLRAEGFFEKNRVDTIFVFGGTNDSWADAPLGEMQFSDWQEKDLFNVLPAICYFACTLKTECPNTKIIFIINTDIKAEIQNGIEFAARYYGLTSIRLKDIDKESGHPTAKGMRSICEQLLRALV